MAKERQKQSRKTHFSPESLDLKNLHEGEDFYFNKDGLLVFTEIFHLKKGYCCKNHCKHCPYGLAPDN